MDLQIALDHALEAARGAGRILLDRLGHLGKSDIQLKGVTDLVTAADRAAERSIIHALTAHFPEHGIRGEEATDRSGAGRFMWYVDPLDGTTNFVHGLPHFCVSIGLVEAGEPILGVVHAPALGETFHAVRGEGAFLGDRPLKVSGTDKLLSALVCTGFACVRDGIDNNNVATFARLIWQTQGIRRLGSAALDLAYVAAGRFDAFWELALAPWDVAAGALLVAEAGGRVTQVSGGPDYLLGKSILASNGVLHGTLLERLSEPDSTCATTGRADGTATPSARATGSSDSLAWLGRQIAGFVRDRDWEQFHGPKNLAMSLAIEAAELMEIFQWLDPDGAERLLQTPGEREHLSEEMADCLAYLISLSNRSQIDLGRALVDKIAKNGRKYPVDRWRGRARPAPGAADAPKARDRARRGRGGGGGR